VARDACRAGQVVIIVDVAIGAQARRNRVIPRERESGAVVIERRVRPSACAMARIASLGEVRGHVIRIGRALVILQVATHASCRVQAVVVIDMAVGAGPRRNRVQAREGETGARMIKRRVHPVRRVMAGIASLREIRRHVVGIGRSLVILQVATHASCRVQAVVVVDMAVGAGSRWHRVHSRESETGARMIKRRVHPVRGVVARIASLREVRRHVVGIGRSLIVLQVATDAGRTGQVVIVVDVAIGAGPRRHRVQTSQREPGAGVIKRGIQPGAGAVARIASLREIRRHVIGIGRPLIVL